MILPRRYSAPRRKMLLLLPGIVTRQPLLLITLRDSAADMPYVAFSLRR